LPYNYSVRVARTNSKQISSPISLPNRTVTQPFYIPLHFAVQLGNLALCESVSLAGWVVRGVAQTLSKAFEAFDSDCELLQLVLFLIVDILTL